MKAKVIPDTHKKIQESQDGSLFDPTGHQHIIPQMVGIFMRFEESKQGPTVPIVVCQNCRKLMEEVVHGRIEWIRASIAAHPVNNRIFELTCEYRNSVTCATSWMENIDGYTRGKTNVVLVERLDLTKRSNIFERWERAGLECGRFSEQFDATQDIDERIRLLSEVRRVKGIRTFLRTLMGGASPIVLGDEGFQAKYRLKT